MRRAKIFINGIEAGILTEIDRNQKYQFIYHKDYQGNPLSLTMPLSKNEFTWQGFPAYFDGLLPEGPMLENLLKTCKIDRNDSFSQLITTGSDLVGHCTVVEINEEGDSNE